MYGHLEVHYLNYLLHIGDKPTENAIIEMVDIFVNKNAAFEGFSKEFKVKYKEMCVYELKKYDKLKLSDKKNRILKYWTTWDNYSLSVIYIKFLFYITKTNSEKILKNNFVQHFTEILLLNIHPNPEKRLSLLKTIKLFNKFLFNTNINQSSTFQEIVENMEKNKASIDRSIKINERKLNSVTEKSIRTTLR